MSKIEVDKIDPQSGTDLELGTSGDTITIPAGVTFDSSAATNTLPATVVTTTGTQTLTNKSIATTQLTGTITPSDSTVSLAKLTATGTKDATTFLRGDNTFAEVPAGGITEADQWRLTANLTGDANPISSNLERVDSTGFGYIGSGMTESSGVYTFPSTGIYSILFTQTNKNASQSSRYSRLDLDVTTDNSNYTAVAYAMTSLSHINSSTYNNATGQYIFDVTNTSTHKVRFAVEHATPGTTDLVGTTTENYTVFTFIRLGDT